MTDVIHVPAPERLTLICQAGLVTWTATFNQVSEATARKVMDLLQHPERADLPQIDPSLIPAKEQA